MRKKMTPRLVLLFAILATALIAIGCGGDDDDDDGGTADATTTTTEEMVDLGLIEDGTLIVGSDIPFPPFEQGDPPDYDGFDIDLINAVAERLGLETQIDDRPFDLILQGGNGRFDLGIAATTITEEREQEVDFSDPYFLAEQSLLVQADGDIQSVDDLAGTTVGAQDGTTGETYASDETEAGDVRPFPEIDDAYNALENGQVDAVINDLPSTQAVAADSGGSLEVVEVFETGELYGIVFPQGAGPLLDAVNEALQEIKDDGTLDELYMEWFDKEAPESLKSATNEPT